MQRFRSIRAKAFSVGLGLALALTATAADDDTATGVAPNISIDDIMVGAIEPASNGLWAVAMEENAPQNDRDWKALESHAIQLISATSAMTLGGTGAGDMARAKDPRWRDYSEQLLRISKQALDAARNQDLDGVLDAGNVLIEPCSNCHADFPPSDP